MKNGSFTAIGHKRVFPIKKWVIAIRTPLQEPLIVAKVKLAYIYSFRGHQWAFNKVSFEK